jgi:hypothetical protein
VALNTSTTGTAYAMYASSPNSSTAYAIEGSAANVGVYGHSIGAGGFGIYGDDTASSGTGYAGYFVNSSTGAAYGVYGTITGAANTGYAGFFNNTATSGANYGVYGSDTSASGYGGYFANTSTGYALYASGSVGVLGSTFVNGNGVPGDLVIAGASDSYQYAILELSNNLSGSSQQAWLLSAPRADNANAFDLVYDNGGSFNTYMTILSNGEVGIGGNGASPSHALQVSGGGGYNVDLAVNGRIQSGDSTHGGGLWADSANTMFLGAENSNILGLWNGGWGLSVTATESVGIGTTSPSRALSVVTSNSSGGVANIQNTSANGWSALDLLDSSGTLQGGLGYGNSSLSAPWVGTVYVAATGSSIM